MIYPYVKGGAEKRFWELAKRLSLRGYQVHIFGMKSWQGSPYLIKDGVYIHGLGRSRKLYLKSGIRSIKQVLFFAFHILPSLWREKFDIIDCNAFPYLSFFPVKLFSLIKRIPLVITWQEVWGNYWYRYLGFLKGFIARLIERIVIKLSDNIVAHSLKTKQELIRFGVDEKNKNISIIPPGIDLRMIEVTPPSSENTDLIFVGRLIEDKNIDILIKSVSLIRKEFKNIKCLIIGEGSEKEKLITLVDNLRLKDNVIFNDFCEYEEIISFMKASKIFVFPSSREGFGIVVIEAMASGLPVVTVKHPMNASCELIKDGQNGFICKLDEKDISQKILELLRDGSLRNDMAKVAKDSVKEYDWDMVVGENEEFYNYVIRKNSIS